MSQTEIKKGFDAPKNKKEDDLLNRWRFAKEIYSIAKNTPEDWSVRIGIYAGWGEGKSTVLKFIENMANSDNHLSLFFNPWQFSTDEDLWENFILEVIEKIQEKNIKIPDVKSIKNRINYNRIVKTGDVVSEAIKDIPYVGKFGIPFLKLFLSENRKHLEKLGKALKGKKFIIIFDDLDRANPKIVPQILYALREILDLPGFSFILAFDPKIVSKALTDYHIGFDETLDFLDKIIDFPKWLPPTNNEDLIRLAKNDISRYCPYLPVDSLIQVFKFLPQNPRALRRFIRLFFGLEKELNRYNSDEIDWIQFLLVQKLKNYYPILAYELFDDVDLWQEIFTNRLFGERRSGPGPRDKHKQMIRDLCTTHKITEEEEINQIIEIIEIIAKRDQRLSNINMKRYLTITESPLILTWKEFNTFLLEYEKNKKKDFINKFLESHSIKFDFEKSSVLKYLFSMVIEYRIWCLNEASQSTYETKLKSHLNDSLLALDIIDKLSFDLNGFKDPNPVLDSKDFKRLYEMMTRWLQLTNPKEHSNVRKIERDFLITLASQIEGNLIQIFSELTPWMSNRVGVYDSKKEKTLSEKISTILENRICETFINNFQINNWVFSISDRGEHQAEHYLIFRLNSPLWKNELKKNFFKMLDDNLDNEVIRRNITELLFLFNDSLFEMYDAGKIYNDKSILCSKNITLKIWKYVLHSKLNPRKFHSFNKLKEKIEGKFEYKLPFPRWWKPMNRVMNRTIEE
jgi:hypothetical protein